MSESLQGYFLVASPHLNDPNFFRSVVLMVQHDESGAFGLVVNRPSRQRVDEMWKQVTDQACHVHSPVFLGGPIAGPIMLLHNAPHEADLAVKTGIYFASDREKILRLISAAEDRLQLFNGYSGWGPGQLEQELKIGGWLTVSATPEAVFATPHDALWQELTHQIGREITRKALRISEPPADPDLN